MSIVYNPTTGPVDLSTGQVVEPFTTREGVDLTDHERRLVKAGRLRVVDADGRDISDRIGEPDQAAAPDPAPEPDEATIAERHQAVTGDSVSEPATADTPAPEPAARTRGRRKTQTAGETGQED